MAAPNFPLIPVQESHVAVSPDGIPQNDGTATDCATITPSDSTVFVPIYRALYVGVTGDVTVRTIRGTTVKFTAHPVGYLLAMVDQVKATGTTATNILGLV
jgi:hypothetical protein